MNRRHRKKKAKKQLKCWKDEKDKCKNGTTINEIHITGSHYFYLNYYQVDGVFPALRSIDINTFKEVEKNTWDITKPYIFHKGRKVGKPVYSFASAENNLKNLWTSTAEKYLEDNPIETRSYYDEELIEEMKNFKLNK